jgi:cytochrome c2
MDENLKDIIRKQSATLALMFTIIILLVVVIICIVASINNGYTVVKKEEPLLLCGNAMEPAIAQSRIRRNGINGNYQNGITLFKKNCAVCHTTTDMKLTGPGLKGVYDRVPKPTGEWLRNYILNSEKIRKKGDPYAKKLFKEYGGAEMTVFEGQLSDQEVTDIVYYIAAN